MRLRFGMGWSRTITVRNRCASGGDITVRNEGAAGHDFTWLRVFYAQCVK